MLFQPSGWSAAKFVDVVFVASDHYGPLTRKANLDAFVADACELIQNGLWKSDVFVKNPTLFSLTYSASYRVDVHNGTAANNCPIVRFPGSSPSNTPPPWSGVDVFVVLHEEALNKECASASKGYLTAAKNDAASWMNEFGTFVHELGHAYFWLPDETCCLGWYRSAPPVMYGSESGCNNANYPPPCEHVKGDYWRSEIADDQDIMRNANTTPPYEFGAADWVYMESTLAGLGNPAGVVTPTRFGPDTWLP